MELELESMWIERSQCRLMSLCVVVVVVVVVTLVVVLRWEASGPPWVPARALDAQNGMM